MNTKEAVAKRILELCEERNMAINALATVSGVSPSTIYSIGDVCCLTDRVMLDMSLRML